VRRIILILAVALIMAAVMLPTIAQTRDETIGQAGVTEKGKAKGKAKGKVAVPTTDRFILLSDGTLFALGTGALLIGGGLLVHRIVRTEALD
jgi:hypothetical protein